MEKQYFTRKIKEGSVKRTHVCSFDRNIKLEMIVTGSKKVLDYLVRARADEMSGEKKDNGLSSAKEDFMTSLSGLRVNGLPVIYEDLNQCFDSEEIIEVMAFVNGADMTVFGGEAKAEKNA